MDRARNAQFLYVLTEAQKRGDLQTFEDLSARYALENSWPICHKDFGEHSHIAKQILDRLHGLKVDVRRTEPNFMWGFGKYPQSMMAKCVTRSKGSFILLDIVGPNQKSIELIDSLLHESVHCTGPLLNRWHADKQPKADTSNGGFRMNDAYLHEEAVAIVGSMKMQAVLGISAVPKQTLLKVVVETLYTSQKGKKNKIDMQKIDFESNAAVGMLQETPKVWNSFGRKMRLAFSRRY